MRYFEEVMEICAIFIVMLLIIVVMLIIIKI